ncbi:MAG: prenyltransferase/squalene oxidase repeat-containing protein [Verrucomicrobiales bacterium]
MESPTYANAESIAHFNFERAQALHRQREKAGKYSALIVTVAVHLVAILFLTLILLPALQEDAMEIIDEKIRLEPTEQVTSTPNLRVAKAKPTAPSTGMKVITAPNTSSPVFAPPTIQSNLSQIGSGAAMGMGFGGPDGIGDGQNEIENLPPDIQGRCTTQERLKRLREGGGNEECEAAVVRSLRWLKANQNSDGSWGTQYKASMTGLALLAFLGHCETPRSREYGQTVTMAITFLVNMGNGQNGKLSMIGGHGWVYEHAIGTYALCEALIFIKELKMPFPSLQETCEKAVQIVLDGQHPSGSWDYNYSKASSRPGDTSIFGWHVQALKAASHAGLEKKDIEKAVDRALKRLEQVQNESGTFGYTGKGSPNDQRLAGVGALCFQMWGKENSRPAREAIRWMSKEMDPVYHSPDCNLYAWYYTTLCLFQKGGSTWDRWNKKWRDQLLDNQNEDGIWKQEGNFGKGATSTSAGGRDADIYRLCLNALSLEAYYRFLPGTGGESN